MKFTTFTTNPHSLKDTASLQLYVMTSQHLLSNSYYEDPIFGEETRKQQN